MGDVSLDDILVTPLKRIPTVGGDVLHALKKTDSGFDVALAREHGTKRHFIAPRVKLALSWITLGIRYPGPMVTALQRSDHFFGSVIELSSPRHQVATPGCFDGRLPKGWHIGCFARSLECLQTG